jgi:hypothetical protein
MAGGLWLRTQKYWWQSPDDQRYGRWLMNKQIGALYMPCGTDIVNAIDRVYTLLDASLRGEIHDVTGTGTLDDPYIYDPALPQVVDPVVYLTPGIQFNTQQTYQGMLNLMNGTLSTNFTDPRIFRDQLEAIRALLEAAGTSEADIEGILNLILLALG